jgi:hypothetical protein
MTKSVGAGSYREPGLVVLEKPSKKTTKIKKMVETMPMADA